MEKKYRQLKPGEIVKDTDEYQSYLAPPDTFWPVDECTIGKAILECNAKYYRREIK